MIRYLLSRVVSLILTLVAASVVIFAVLEIIPGDPASLMLGLDAQPATLAALRAQMGLDQPPVQRFFMWFFGLLRGDLGVSYTYSEPVIALIRDRLFVTLPLAGLSLLLTLVLAIPAGVFAASHRGRARDTGIMALTQLGVAIPNFWFAMLLVYVFAILLRMMPSGGFPGWHAGLFPALRALLLPAIALALPQAAILARVMRSSLIDVLHEDYIRTARAKGLTQKETLWRHGVRNALIPVMTIIGMQFSFLVTGTIIIENVFYLPGLGRLIFQAVTQRDLIVVESLLVLIVAFVVVVMFLVDVAYVLIDPRLRTRRA